MDTKVSKVWYLPTTILRGCLPYLNDRNILECECTYGSYYSCMFFLSTSGMLQTYVFVALTIVLRPKSKCVVLYVQKHNLPCIYCCLISSKGVFIWAYYISPCANIVARSQQRQMEHWICKHETGPRTQCFPIIIIWLHVSTWIRECYRVWKKVVVS